METLSYYLLGFAAILISFFYFKSRNLFKYSPTNEDFRLMIEAYVVKQAKETDDLAVFKNRVDAYRSAIEDIYFTIHGKDYKV